MNIFSEIVNDIKSLWKKEEPTIIADLKTVVEAAEPLWETALGKVALSSVTALQGYAASNGGAAAAELAGKQIAASAASAGVTASKSTVNTLIELAVQKIQTAAAELPTAATSTTPTPAAPAAG